MTRLPKKSIIAIMKKIILLFLCIITFALGAFAERTFSFQFDDSGYVSDNARVLAEGDKEIIAYWLKYLENHKNTRIVLVTLDGLKGATASQVAHYTLEYYGKNKKDNTLIFVVSPFENKFGIGMGDDLKSEISYVTLRRVITEEIYPRFQTGNYSLALKEGIFAISSSIEPSLIFIKDVKLPNKSQTNNYAEPEKKTSIMDIVLPITLVILVSLLFVPRITKRKKKVVYPRCGFGVKFGEVMYEEY